MKPSLHPVTPISILPREAGKPDTSWWVCPPDAFYDYAKDAAFRMASVSSRIYKGRAEDREDIRYGRSADDPA